MNFGHMMKQAKEMQSRMEDVNKKIEAMEIDGTAGGEAVRITMNGKGVIKKIRVSPHVVDADEIEILEDLLLAAYHDGKTQADAAHEKEMSKVTGGLKLPGMGF